MVTEPGAGAGDGFEDLYVEPEDRYVESPEPGSDGSGYHNPTGALTPAAPGGVARDQLHERERLIQRRARKRVLKRRAFKRNLVKYVAVNAMLFVIWLVTGGGFPWFLFPLMGWGIGIAGQASDAYSSDDSIEQEAELIRRELGEPK